MWIINVVTRVAHIPISLLLTVQHVKDQTLSPIDDYTNAVLLLTSRSLADIVESTGPGLFHITLPCISIHN